MSKPLKSASSGVPISNGGYGASVPISSVPSVIVETSPPAAVVLVSPPALVLVVSSSSPHPTATNAHNATSAVAKISLILLMY